jgi:hypothetical protein
MAPADVVLGQPDFERGAAAGGCSKARGLHLPTAVTMIDGSWSWSTRGIISAGVAMLPTTCTCLPMSSSASRRPRLRAQSYRVVSATTLYWPYGVGMGGGWFWIADTGNRRVLGWPTLPLEGEAPHVILGQPSATDNSETRGGAPDARSFRWPHAVAGDADTCTSPMRAPHPVDPVPSCRRRGLAGAGAAGLHLQ